MCLGVCVLRSKCATHRAISGHRSSLTLYVCLGDLPQVVWLGEEVPLPPVGTHRCESVPP